MPTPRDSVRGTLIAALALLAAGAGAWAVTKGERDKPDLGLLTTLPIYWSESLEIGEALDSREEPHWARVTLEADYDLLPLDTLDAGEGGLGGLDYLLLAQPRALSPPENVALDDWVRAGGHALVFADPFLTGDSRFGIGDRRRPQDVVLLSPILRRWGLELQFDPGQPDGEYYVKLASGEIPVNLAGRLVEVTGSAPSDCTLSASGLVAECAIGRGRAVVVADAALLEGWRAEPARAQLETLAERAFGR